MKLKIVTWFLFVGVLAAQTHGQTLSIDGIYCKLFNTEVRCTGIDSRNYSKVTFDYKSNTAADINILDSYLHTMPEGLFDIYSKTQKVRMSGVHLQQLPANVFKSGGNLQFLDLSKNEIAEIPADTFKETPKLAEINFSGNKLKVLPAKAFSGIKAPKIRLDFSNNLIERIDPDIFNGMHVDYINLSQNNLTVVDNQFFRNIDPSEINLSNNCLVSIATDTFGAKHNLKNLYLENTCLTFFLYGTLPKSLAKLDISGNPLTYFRWELMATTPNLKELIMKRTVVEPATILGIIETVQLTKIDFSDMKFNCTDLAHIAIAATKAKTTLVVSKPSYDRTNIGGYVCTQPPLK